MELFFSIIGIWFVLWFALLVFDNKYLNGRYLQALKRMSSLEQDFDSLYRVYEVQRKRSEEQRKRIEEVEAFNKVLEGRIDVLREHFNQIASYEVKVIDSEESEE